MCYCPTPLEHERATVYDRYFDDLTTEAVDDYPTHEGMPFLAHLDRLVASAE